MVTKITSATKLMTLLKDYPFLLDYLADYHPEFGKLRNPVARNTIGRIVTMKMIADMGKLSLDKLMTDVASKVKNETGAELQIGPAPADENLRQETLKGIIVDLHAGADLSELKVRFAELIEDVDASEIAVMEQALVEEGFPQEEIKRLCDLHVEVFKEQLDLQEQADTPPGHPIHTFRAENVILDETAADFKKLIESLGTPPDEFAFDKSKSELTELLDKLAAVNIHYLRKENQLFPLLEEKGLTGPPGVMWAIHDDVRALLKGVRAAIEKPGFKALADSGTELARVISDMVYKEENILFPMSLDTLNDDDWIRVRDGEEEIGYALVTPGDEWKPEPGTSEEVDRYSTGLPLDTGVLNLEQINLMLKSLPVDISYIDENDEVRYYSDVEERIFPRSKGVIGRKVQNCHPPASMHIVQEILDRFRDGSREVSEFWIEMGGRFLHIRYFALRGPDGEYKGTLEVSQDITEIRKLEGQQRLLEWERSERETK